MTLGPDIAAESPVLLPLAAGRDGIRLRCLRAFAAPEDAAVLRAFCRGVEVGRLALPPRLAAGAEIALPIARLPRTDLPAELRFALGAAEPDLAPPWPLPNAAAALALLPAPAAPEIGGMRLEQGMLRGVATERANGLLEPVMYARINAAGARGVTTERPWPLPEGGCAFRFALPIEPGDLNESGLTVALHLVGLEAPVARFAWARAAPDAATAPQVAALEARVAALEAQSAATARALAEEVRRQAALLAERSDAFIEAAAALLLDRVAATPSPPRDADPRLAALRRLIAEAAATPPATESLLLGRRAEIPPAAGNLAVGWHEPESDAAGGAFRWMAEAALVVNPEPHRPVAAVTLTVRHHYGAPEPGLAASFDGVPARVTVAPEAGGFVLRLEPEGGGAVPCQALRLTATHGGVPLRDGRNPDPRHLSIAVSRVVFDYGGTAPG